MDQIERAARALCQESGRDPEGRVQTGRMEIIRRPNSVEQRPETEPAWHQHIPEAKRFIAVLKALSVPLSD
jgi:hypothetical protein